MKSGDEFYDDDVTSGPIDGDPKPEERLPCAVCGELLTEAEVIRHLNEALAVERARIERPYWRRSK